MKLKFEKLIKKYSSIYTFTIISEGYKDGPDWIEGEETDYDIKCAIFPFSTKDLVTYEGLGYTTKDIKIFIPVSEIPPTEKLEKNDSLIYQGAKYELDREMDRTTHSDFIKWFAKRVENQ